MEMVVPQISSTVPAFLTKLWRMVDSPDTSHMISWGDEGNSFVIHNQSEFSSSLLPFYYKHSNMASFVRQLNMYGFHKVVAIDSGGLKSERIEEMEFAHPCFLRGQEHLLEKIKRKVTVSHRQTSSEFHSSSNAVAAAVTNFVPAMRAERVNEVLNEVNQLKDKQENMNGKLETMKKENEALWREVVNLRQKHLSQQKIVNKLVQFLVSLVQPRITPPGGAKVVKRCYQPLQLAITEESKNVDFPKNSKVPRISTMHNEDASPGNKEELDIDDVFENNKKQQCPMIQDVTDDNDLCFSPCGVTEVQSTVESPSSPLGIAMQAIDPNLVNPCVKAINRDPPVANHSEPTTSRPVFHREISREDVDVDVNKVQTDLESLKDMLSGQITLDSSLISNLFCPEEPLSNIFTGTSLDIDSSVPSVIVSSTQAGGLTSSSSSSAVSPTKFLALDSDGRVLSDGSDGKVPSSLLQEEKQPILFELSGIDDEDDPTAAASITPSYLANDEVSVPDLSTDITSLNTPLIFGSDEEEANVSPLLANIRKQSCKKK